MCSFVSLIHSWKECIRVFIGQLRAHSSVLILMQTILLIFMTLLQEGQISIVLKHAHNMLFSHCKQDQNDRIMIVRHNREKDSQ